MELLKEQKYEFRKRLRCIHKEKIRDFSLAPLDNELSFSEGVSIVLPEDAGKVILCAAKDFLDYLFTSMKVSASLTYNHGLGIPVFLRVDHDIDSDYIINVTDSVEITGNSERAVAQALYCLEDRMNVRKAPFISKELISHTFMFSPRMVHSGYALDEFPDEHLSAIAHSGMDAILVFVRDVNMTPSGFLDFNELISRASRYGLDVYAYSYYKSELHPDDEGAGDFYDGTYGRLFRECPGFKGIILVGESVAFPSRDERVSPGNMSKAPDGIPYTKPRAGYFPCRDYPEWINCVKKSIRNYSPDADIVFWTYNWGYAPEKERLELIESLPKDISLMVTYEMFETYQVGSFKQTVADYSLAFEGPGFYFESEAKAAAKRGIKLYAMTNTGGLTWDIGTIPYEPMPYQWMKRYSGLRKAHDEYGLCGLMESHHYGFWPSFIGDLAKQCFIAENISPEKCLNDVICSRFGSANMQEILEALKLWSEAIRHYTPSDADQYGAFRCGPSYPLCLIKEIKPPAESFAHFGNRILFTTYPADYAPTTILPCGRGMLPSLRLNGELESLGKMQQYMEEGLTILKNITDPSAELMFLINLGEYICCCVKTGIHAKQWYLTTSKLKTETNRHEVLDMIKEVRNLIDAEMDNAKRALPLTERDSRLGWEPSMDYIGGSDNIKWKIRHLEYVMDFELGCFVNGSDDKWYNI